MARKKSIAHEDALQLHVYLVGSWGYGLGKTLQIYALLCMVDESKVGIVVLPPDTGLQDWIVKEFYMYIHNQDLIN